jgi:altronate dehydratase small subunit
MAFSHKHISAEDNICAANGFAVIMNSNDNVATLIRDAKKGTKVKINGDEVEIIEDISFGHKFAIRDIRKGESVIKYGAIIGRAKTPIKKGEHVHVHNVHDVTGELRDKVLAERSRN